MYILKWASDVEKLVQKSSWLNKTPNLVTRKRKTKKEIKQAKGNYEARYLYFQVYPSTCERKYMLKFLIWQLNSRKKLLIISSYSIFNDIESELRKQVLGMVASNNRNT